MIASLLLVFLILICYVIYKNKTLPPGPYGLPYLGIGLLFGKPDYRRLDQMAADYGDIVSFRAFGRLFVCLNSSAVIREAMLKYSSVFNGRATMNLNGFLANKHGISNYNGNDIVHIKKLFNRLYKDLNFVEDVTTLAADELTIHLKHNFHHIKSCIGLAVFKTTYCLLFASSNCPLRNQDILEFLNQMSSNNEAHSIISAKQILPFLKRPIFSNNRLIQKLFGMSASITRYGKMMSYIKYLIREGIVHQTGNNVISKYQELFCTSESTKDGDENIARLIFEIFAGASDTTIATLTWGFVYVAMHPVIQEKVRAEIRSYLSGKQSHLNLRELNKLPLTLSVLEEVYRLATVTPCALLHETSQEVDFRGYHIPKDTLIICNLYSSHRKNTVWYDPLSLDPLRHLNNKNEFTSCKHNIPFGVGRRSCPGESLARYMVILLFTSVLKRFHITCERDENFDRNGSSGLVRYPTLMQLKLTFLE